MKGSSEILGVSLMCWFCAMANLVSSFDPLGGLSYTFHFSRLGSMSTSYVCISTFSFHDIESHGFRGYGFNWGHTLGFIALAWFMQLEIGLWVICLKI